MSPVADFMQNLLLSRAEDICMLACQICSWKDCSVLYKTLLLQSLQFSINGWGKCVTMAFLRNSLALA